MCADGGEFDALRASRAVRIYNCYVDFGADTPAIARAAEVTRDLGALGVKWNFPNNPARADVALDNARRFADLLPPEVRLLCECHPGTIAETPAAAASLLDKLGDPSRIQAIVHSAIGPQRLAEWFTAIPDRITHVHAVITGRLSGETPHAGIEFLRSRNYAGTISLEFTGEMGTPDDTPESNFARAAQDLKTLHSLLG